MTTPNAMPTPTEIYTDAQHGVLRSFEQIRRARNLGILSLVMAAVTAWQFTGRAGSATFNLDSGRSFGIAATPFAWL
ncbi:MAG TPA: hypothetical protein PLV68_00730, partial [Ilumatobacteraceae bacterium]|nr:hypothetical protein [Ilumatobacteraceae bacterium]